ncbi:hypothetical protein [Vibrio sp. 10N.247.311.51]|uniref:hypothetical protein n=1 Tax=Vibrio sp. 10N.247.311.51 TaxID=3229996 RepID=UPI00354C3214
MRPVEIKNTQQRLCLSETNKGNDHEFKPFEHRTSQSLDETKRSDSYQWLELSRHPKLYTRARRKADNTSSGKSKTGIHKHDIDKLCLFLNHPLVELNKEHDDYRYQRGLLFYVLSRQARVNTTGHDVKNTLGSFSSKSQKVQKKTGNTKTKESCDGQ